MYVQASRLKTCATFLLIGFLTPRSPLGVAMEHCESTILCGIIGAGGFGRKILPLIEHSLYWKYLDSRPRAKICFVESKPESSTLNGIPIMSLEAFINTSEQKCFTITVADSKKRELLAQQLLASGAIPLEVLAPTHQNMMGNEIGKGSIFCHFTTITCNSRIGKFFHGNLYSYIGHDCLIGDYVTFAPSVHCNGNVHIGNHAYIGTGACIKQGNPDAPLTIGEGAIIGMGAVVTRSVAPYTTVAGNPARLLNTA